MALYALSMRRVKVILVLLLFSISTNFSKPAFAADWTMTQDSVSTSMKGVSPHVEHMNGVDRVWRSEIGRAHV